MNSITTIHKGDLKSQKFNTAEQSGNYIPA